MRKKRGYSREVPMELVRDYKLFAIACEGSKREPEYFKIFRFFSKKIAVDVIEDIVTDENPNTLSHNSAPKWVLDRALKYVDKEGLSEEDDLWFVMDVDRWDLQQLREIGMYCEKNTNWHIVLSNPCFEVWLYFHKKANIKLSASKSCGDFKNEISTFQKGGYHPLKFIPDLPTAIKNAKAVDRNKNHYMPNFKESKVYELGEAVFKVIGINGFNNFLKHSIPKLIQDELNKNKLSIRKSSKKKQYNKHKSR